MKKTDTLVKMLREDIEGKDVLEVACGTAELSLSAAKLADRVVCIDLDDSRLNDKVKESDIDFQIMDAAAMSFDDEEFDTIFIYNAFFHIQSQWKLIEKECKRVIKKTGKIYIIGTWSLDTSLMKDVFGDAAIWHDGFLIVELRK